MKFERLGKIVAVSKGKKITVTDLPDVESIRVLQIDDLRNDNDIKYTNKKVGVYATKKDILIAWDGAYAGTIGYGKEGVIGSTIAVLRIKDHQKWDTGFLGKYLETQTKFLRAKARGATIPHIDRAILNSLQVPCFDLSDQIKIASILSRAATLIKQREETLNLLDEFIRCLFLQTFGDPVANDKHWEKVEIKKFGQIITGNTPSKSVAENYSSEFLEWIKTDNITSKGTYITSAIEYLSETGSTTARTAEDGALLVACIAGSVESLGRAALTNRKVSFNQQINAIQPNNTVSPLFLYWLFRTSKKYIESFSSKGMKKMITKGVFEKIKLIRPPIEIQKPFVNVTEKVELVKKQLTESCMN